MPARSLRLRRGPNSRHVITSGHCPAPHPPRCPAAPPPRPARPEDGDRPWTMALSSGSAMNVATGRPQTRPAYSGRPSGPFDAANRHLDARLPDGPRLSAVRDVTLRPAVSIRRARMGKVFLADLVGNGALLPEAAAFLAAATAARKNIMIAGATNAGKTTLLRAIANQIPASERLITVERALELGIDPLP